MAKPCKLNLFEFANASLNAPRVDHLSVLCAELSVLSVICASIEELTACDNSDLKNNAKSHALPMTISILRISDFR